jgi:HK97 family phage portal protein
MTFIGRTLAMATREVIPFTPSTYDDAFPLALFGSRIVTPESAMTIAIAYACTRVVSEDIAKIPLQIYETVENGKELARDHEWYDALHHQSNEFQTAIEMREMMTAFALNRGRGIAEKRTRRVRLRGGGSVLRRELVPLHPDLIARRLTEEGDVVYEYTDPIKRKVRRILPDELLIVRGFNGVGVIEVARRSFEEMLQQRNFAIETWRKGPRHTGVIQRPKDAPKWNDTNRKVFRESLEEYQGGGEREGRPLLLEDGMTWENSSFSMQDSQFLGMLQHTVAEGCRWYRVPQHKVQELGRSTNNNIEQQSRDYISDSLMSWAVRWEQAIGRDCIDEPFFAKHNLDALLRGDTKERAEAHAIYVNTGIKTQDEIREIEDLNRMGGEAAQLRQALNMGSNVPGTSAALLEIPDRVSDVDLDYRSALTAKVRAFSQDAAGRVYRREMASLAKLAEKTGPDGAEWRDGVDAFYRDFTAVVARQMRCTPEAAEAYCGDRRFHVLSMGLDADESPVADLVELAVNQSFLALPGAAA